MHGARSGPLDHRPDRPCFRGRLVLFLGMRRYRKRGQRRYQQKESPGAPGNFHLIPPRHWPAASAYCDTIGLSLAGWNYLVLLQICKLEGSRSQLCKRNCAKRLQNRRERFCQLWRQKATRNFACFITCKVIEIRLRRRHLGGAGDRRGQVSAISTSMASSFETHRYAMLLWMRSQTLMVRSASSRRLEPRGPREKQQ